MRPIKTIVKSNNIVFHLREISIVPDNQIDKQKNKRCFSKSLWLFGNTKDNRSVAVMVKNFRPYLYIKQNESFDVEDLNDNLRLWDNGPDLVTDVRSCEMTELIGFTNNLKKNYLRLEYLNDSYTKKIVKELSKKYVVYHHDWGLDNLFLNECHISMQDWIEVTGRRNSVNRLTSCEFELVSDWKADIRKCDTQSIIPPILCCSLRMRAASHKFKPDQSELDKNVTPCPKSDPIILISASVYWMCDEEKFIDRSFVGSEQNILYEFEKFVNHHDIDCFVYLSDNFDILQYIALRKPSICLSKFSNFNSCLFRSFDNKYINVRHYGRSKLNIQAALKKMMIEPRLDGFTLKDAVFHDKIVRQKPHEQLKSYSTTNNSYIDFEIVRSQCEEENLWLKCIEHQNFMLLGFVEVSAASYTQLTVSISNGQQIRVWKKLTNAFHNENLIVNKELLELPPLVVKKNVKETSFVDPEELPNIPINQRDGIKKNRKTFDLFGKTVIEKKQKTKKKYEGGYVCAPKSGFYKTPIFTFDFSSHYPSIIQAYEICYMRLLWNKEYLEDDRFVKIYIPIQPMDKNYNVDCVVLVKGIICEEKGFIPARTVLCKIIAEVGKQRKSVKLQMKKTKDIFLYNSLDAKQLSCKVFQNAVYGFLGVEYNALLSCPVLMASVCKIGQHMTKKVKHHMLSEYDACVVYGDTDSVMVQFPPPKISDHDEKMEYYYGLANSVAKKVTSLFTQPCQLEFESMKLPYILYKKKNYAALEYNASSWLSQPKTAIKGMPFKKRDRCPFVRKTGYEITNMLLNFEDDKIIPVLKKRCEDLIQGRISVADLCITCQIQDQKSYKSQSLIQLETAKKLQRRNGVFYEPGSRLSYVVIQGKEPLYKRGEDPNYCISNNIELDLLYYYEKQFLSAIEPLLQFHSHIDIKNLKQYMKNKLKRKLINVISLKSMIKKKSKLIQT